MTTHIHDDCPHCRGRATVQHRSIGWLVALVGAYVLFSVMVFGASLLGPTIMAVLPFLAATGLGLLPFLHERAGAPPTCTACGRIVDAEHATRARARPATTATMRVA